MPRALFLLGLLVARCALGTDLCASQGAPVYTAASIVNAADNRSDKLAPNTIGTIYGANLACSTAGLTTGDLVPTNLGEAAVIIHGQPAGLFYVSPTQINFLVPPIFEPGPVEVYVTVLTLHGPIIQLTLALAAPGLFQLAPGTCQLPSGVSLQCAVATLADGTVLTPASSPAKPGDIVVLWATGLGPTEGLQPDNDLQVPTVAEWLVPSANIEVLLDGVAVAPSAIDYAGVAPGFAGLYQINLTLPKSTGANPEIRLQLDGAISIPKVYLPVVLN
jgi:uncharacterized protein (TIGR03437 family)